jgi:CheY-like chemotaxis protein
MMPVLDGLRALPKIVESGVRAVMLTGLLHEDVINRASLRGASGFVNKANVEDDLIETLRVAAGPLGDRSFVLHRM